jgi:hypothetical protein
VYGGSKGRPADDERHHQMSRKSKNNGINNPDWNITWKASILTYLSRG